MGRSSPSQNYSRSELYAQPFYTVGHSTRSISNISVVAFLRGVGYRSDLSLKIRLVEAAAESLISAGRRTDRAGATIAA
jgi:hypothetical protein